MAHEVQSMMYAGEVPWHRLGTKLENPATAAEAIKAAGLDWDVQREPIYTGVNRDVRIVDRFAICRTDRLDQKDGGQLAVVGRDFTPLQNREAFGFLDPVVGEGGAVYHTAGSLRGGRRIWMLAKLPGHIRVIGDDVAEKYVLLSNGHDGTAAVRIGLTPIRVVCQNTLSLALAGMSGLLFHHNPDVVKRVQQAHRLLGIVNERLNEAEAVMQQLAKVTLTPGRMAEYFERVLATPKEDDDQRERVRQKHDRWTQLTETGDGNQMNGVRGTLWAAYNGITQWVDRESFTKRNKEPLNTMWFGDGARLKQRAFNVAQMMIANN